MNDDDGKLRVKIRLGILFGCIALALGVLGWNLYKQQIIYGEKHRDRILRQSFRRTRVPARRGKILSADMKVLAGNQARTDLLFYPEEMRRPGGRRRTVEYITDVSSRIAALLGRRELGGKAVRNHLTRRPGMPLAVADNLTLEECAALLEALRGVDGAALEPDYSRVYPEKSLASHLIGFARKENPGDAADRKDFFYYIPDWTGKAGLELAFDEPPAPGVRTLRGFPGYTLAQVDSQQYVYQRVIQKTEPMHGGNLQLFLDSRAQRIAEELLRDQRGAFVLLDADTGAVLAMASAPDYDPSRLTPDFDLEYYRDLQSRPGRPMFNRALYGTYTPGSILKVLTALAILRDGVNPEDRVVCDGYSHIGDARIRCTGYRQGGHGALNMIQALRYSCNAYFIQKGTHLRLEKIAPVLEAAGLGRSTPFDLGSRSGIFPGDARKRQIYKSAWNNYDTALLSIGQGLITITPLQAAVYTAALANGGTLIRPRLVRAILSDEGEVVWENPFEVFGELNATGEALEIVRKGMFEVVNTSDGSGRKAKLDAMTLYGKTGSAEVGSRENREINAWFIAFGTCQERRYAAVMLLESARSGGTSVAPLVAEFFRRYLKFEK